MASEHFEYGVEYNRALNDPTVKDVMIVVDVREARDLANGYLGEKRGADGRTVRRRVTIGDWETVPEREDCPCGSCVSTVVESRPWPDNIVMPFIVCETCGNKRCPHATHHDNECTRSNEPEQRGSRYGGLE